MSTLHDRQESTNGITYICKRCGLYSGCLDKNIQIACAVCGGALDEDYTTFEYPDKHNLENTLLLKACSDCAPVAKSRNAPKRFKTTAGQHEKCTKQT